MKHDNDDNFDLACECMSLASLVWWSLSITGYSFIRLQMERSAFNFLVSSKLAFRINSIMLANAHCVMKLESDM